MPSSVGRLIIMFQKETRVVTRLKSYIYAYVKLEPLSKGHMGCALGYTKNWQL